MYWNINHRPGLDGSVGWIGPVSLQLIITIVAVPTICTVKTKPLSKSKSWQLNLRGLTDFFFFLGWRKWFTAVQVGGKIWRKDSSRCGTGPFLKGFYSTAVVHMWLLTDVKDTDPDHSTKPAPSPRSERSRWRRRFDRGYSERLCTGLDVKVILQSNSPRRLCWISHPAVTRRKIREKKNCVP